MRLAVECLVIFFLIPALLYFFRRQLAFMVVPLVLPLAGLCAYLLIRDAEFDTGRLYRTRGLWAQVKLIMLLLAGAGIVITGLTYLLAPELFLALPLAKPHIWIFVMLLYPILAAYPQEIIFRGFFFHRYRKLFPNPVIMVLVSSISFGLAHIFYGNWLGPVLSGIGGVLFGYRYLKSDTVVAAGLEHGLWGDFLFTIGLGWYFYSGSIS
jgi:membrane protease YdiL (CAAX protease family)